MRAVPLEHALTGKVVVLSIRNPCGDCRRRPAQCRGYVRRLCACCVQELGPGGTVSVRGRVSAQGAHPKQHEPRHQQKRVCPCVFVVHSAWMPAYWCARSTTTPSSASAWSSQNWCGDTPQPTHAQGEVLSLPGPLSLRLRCTPACSWARLVPSSTTTSRSVTVRPSCPPPGPTRIHTEHRLSPSCCGCLIGLGSPRFNRQAALRSGSVRFRRRPWVLAAVERPAPWRTKRCSQDWHARGATHACLPCTPARGIHASELTHASPREFSVLQSQRRMRIAPMAAHTSREEHAQARLKSKGCAYKLQVSCPGLLRTCAGRGTWSWGRRSARSRTRTCAALRCCAATSSAGNA